MSRNPVSYTGRSKSNAPYKQQNAHFENEKSSFRMPPISNEKRIFKKTAKNRCLQTPCGFIDETYQ